MKNKTWQRGLVFVAASASRPSFHWQVMEVTEGLFIMQSCYIFLYLTTLLSSYYSHTSLLFSFSFFPVCPPLFARKFIYHFLTNIVELIYDGGVLDPIRCLLNYNNLNHVFMSN
jgi:hypothetical protein